MIVESTEIVCFDDGRSEEWRVFLRVSIRFSRVFNVLLNGFERF